MNKSYCFIINCASNSKKAASIFRDHESFLSSEFPNSEFVYIGNEDSIRAIAKEKATTHTYIVACGGDGTIHEVVNGLIGTSAVMGILPLGSGNDFAQGIGLDNNFRQSVSVLHQNNIQKLDVIKTGSDYFINTYGIGLDGLTNHIAANLTIPQGFLKYVLSGFIALFKSKPFDVTIKFKTENTSHFQKSWMVAIANGKTEGGRYRISPDSKYDDGITEIIVVNAINRIHLILEFIKLSLGYSFDQGVITTFKLKENIVINTSRELKVHADGEQVINPGNQFKIQMCKQAIPVITGENT